MARIARIVVPGHPHHVTQRGNRRLEVFFGADDYRAYRRLFGEYCARAGVAVWAYCLMPNHVHLILTPEHPDALRAALGEAHRRYTRRINFRHGWRGHLWQERFHSFAMDEDYLLACARYVELNPVRAGLVKRAEDWPWSSARAHLAAVDDGLVMVEPLLAREAAWRSFLDSGVEAAAMDSLRQHSRTGRPAGSESYLDAVEAILQRPVKPRRPGRPRKTG